MADHQWLIIASYEFSEDELKRHAAAPDSPIGLSHQHLISVTGPACFKCEAFWHDSKGTPCPVADPSERMPKDEALKLKRTFTVEEFRRE